MTQPDYRGYREWLNWMLTWPKPFEHQPWAPPEQPGWWPPYPENRRLPLRQEDV